MPRTPTAQLPLFVTSLPRDLTGRSPFERGTGNGERETGDGKQGAGNVDFLILIVILIVILIEPHLRAEGAYPISSELARVYPISRQLRCRLSSPHTGRLSSELARDYPLSSSRSERLSRQLRCRISRAEGPHILYPISAPKAPVSHIRAEGARLPYPRRRRITYPARAVGAYPRGSAAATLHFKIY